MVEPIRISLMGAQIPSFRYSFKSKMQLKYNDDTEHFGFMNITYLASAENRPPPLVPAIEYCAGVPVSRLVQHRSWDVCGQAPQGR